MALSDFEIFAQVISTGSLSSAGRNLGFTPAMVSKRIKGLEARLGVRLIQRTTRCLALTDTGQAFHQRVTAIIQAIEEAEAFVSRRAQTARGKLRIAAPTSFGRMHLLPKLSCFVDENPDIDLEIELTDGPVDLVVDRIDAAIRIGVPEDSRLVMRRIAPAHRRICAAPAYLDQLGHPHRIEDLAMHRLLAVFSETMWELEGPQGTVIAPVRSVIRTGSNDVVREALLAGMGIGLCTSWDIADDLASGRLVELLPDYRSAQESGLYVLYPSRRQLPASVRAFIDHVGRAHRQEPQLGRAATDPADTWPAISLTPDSGLKPRSMPLHTVAA